MLVFNGSDGMNNVIHVIIGPQSSITLDLVGRLELDLEQVRQSFPNSNLPLRLVMTRSVNEEETVSHIRQYGFQQQASPFTHAIENRSIDDLPDRYINDHDDPRGLYEDELVCPLCKTHGVYLKADCPPLCADCLAIEAGLDEGVKKLRDILKNKTTPRRVNPRQSKGKSKDTPKD